MPASARALAPIRLKALPCSDTPAASGHDGGQSIVMKPECHTCINKQRTDAHACDVICSVRVHDTCSKLIAQHAFDELMSVHMASCCPVSGRLELLTVV